jgi:hypothetical protein
MSFILLALLLPLSPQQPVPVNVSESQKLKADLEKAYETYCLQARKLNGTVTVYGLEGDTKKLNWKSKVNADKNNLLISYYNSSQRFINADVFRIFGDTKQVMSLGYHNPSKTTRKLSEDYRKTEDTSHPFPIETTRVFASESPTALPLRPLPDMGWSFLDLMDCPAFQITAIENIGKDKNSRVKVSFQVDEAINKKQVNESQLNFLKNGWVIFRPDQLWTIEEAEITTLEFERRKPPRAVTSHLQFAYATPPGGIPILKEIRVTPVVNKDKVTDQKPKQLLYEVDFKLLEAALPAEQAGIKQFGMIKERTAEDWKKEEAERLRLEAEENARIAKIPPEKLKPASKAFEIDPWVLLVGGVVAFILFVIGVFVVTAKKPVKAGV